MQPLVKNFNDGTVSLRELANLTYDLYIIKLHAPKLFDIIVHYFLKRAFTERDLIYLGNRVSVNFVHSLAFCHGTLNNEVFFGVLRRYIVENIDKFNKFQLLKLLDIYKFNVHFLQGESSVRVKQLLEAQLESKQGEKLNESEEEELRLIQ